MTTLPGRDELEKLPLRAIVAYASRCARRVQPLFPQPNRLEERRDEMKLVRTATVLAVEFAVGYDVLGRHDITPDDVASLASEVHSAANADGMADQACTDIRCCRTTSYRDTTAGAAAAAAGSAAFTALCTAHALGAVQDLVGSDCHIQSARAIADAANAALAASNAVGLISIAHTAPVHIKDAPAVAAAAIAIANTAATTDYTALLKILDWDEPLGRSFDGQGNPVEACLDEVLGPLWTDPKLHWFH